MNNLNLKPGDIVLTRSNSFLSKAIRFFMNKERKKWKLSKRELYSHAATIIEMWGRIYVAEALGTGINVRPFDEAYGNKLKDIKVKTPKKNYSKKEQELISKIASNDSHKPHRYDFLNFIYHIDSIRRTTDPDKKKWIGPKGDKAKKRLYCTEAVATWSNAVRPDTFKEPWATSPIDVDLNKYYKVKFDGVSTQN